MKTIWIKNEAYKNIISGRKLIEGRLNKGIFSKLKSDDILILSSNKDSCKIKIINIINCNNFNELFSCCDLNKILPDKTSVKDGIKHYNNIYKNKDIQKYGVLGIVIKLI